MPHQEEGNAAYVTRPLSPYNQQKRTKRHSGRFAKSTPNVMGGLLSTIQNEQKVCAPAATPEMTAELTLEAAKKLYAGEISPEAVSMLLVNEHFAMMTKQIAQLRQGITHQAMRAKPCAKGRTRPFGYLLSS